jgi:integrase
MASTSLTDAFALKAPKPTGGNQVLYYDDSSPLALRVTAAGARTWIAQVWLRPGVAGTKGKSVRRSIATVEQIGAREARKQAQRIAGELIAGLDRLEEARAEKAEAKADALTLTDALTAYCKNKKRAKDGLSLKERTIHDYLRMVEEGGALAGLASKPLHRITADAIRQAYTDAAKRSQHGAAAAMRCLRATLNWHGVRVEGSPFDRATPGRDRIALPSSAGDPTPIPAERLHAWWAAASARAGDVSADALRFQLLTGCRPGEVVGSAFALGIRVGDVDIEGARLRLTDTKNRRDHIVMLASQALDIVQHHCKGKKATDKVFDVVETRKTLDAINKAAGLTVRITPHKLRATFASVAEAIVSAYTLRSMLNHSAAGDVTANHYIGHSEAKLRAGWQAVADFIAPEVA